MIAETDTDFAALTAPLAQQRAAATKETSRARPKNCARLHPITRWKIALQYAMGVKVDCIGAEFKISGRHVSGIAVRFGLPLRGHKPVPQNPADVEHLRRWARRKADAMRREAAEWAVIAELE
ncbi:MAG TPA: hypothetical protein VK178_07065 [Opitutaceae bacterium]|nr:hypothetical protein [Opitutaceae bacterium]